MVGRRKRYATFQPKPGTHAGGLDYLFRGLREEAAQLRDLLDLVQSGKRAHVRGLAARLRLLLHREGQVPVLPAAAAAKDAALIVYTNGNPNTQTPLAPALVMIGGALSAVPTPMCPNPIDLDVWLGLTAIEIGGKKLPNEKVLVDLGNTLGSHLDLNIQPSVVSLRANSVGIAGTLEDSLTRYITEVAGVVLVLCERLLAEP